MLFGRMMKALLLGALMFSPLQAGEDESSITPIEKVLKKASSSKGFFGLHRKDDTLYLEVGKRQLEKDFFFFSSLSHGSIGYMMPGWTLSQGVYYFKRIGDELWLFERNTSGTASRNSPEATAVERAYLDSLIHKFSIEGADKGQNRLLVKFDSFLYDYAGGLIPPWMSQFMGILSTIPQQSYVKEAKAFPENLEFQVQTTVRLNPSSWMTPDSNQLVFHFSILERKKSDYRPRRADERIGYFTTEVQDYSNLLEDQGIRRNILRWNLQKSDPKARNSVVKKPIVFWLDRSIPHEYRPYVRAGILEWNKAYEKLGFIGAVEARLPEEGMDLDPSDSRYATVSWVASAQGLAVGPSRYDPETGEILDADVILSAGWVTYMDQDFNLFGPLSEGMVRAGASHPDELKQKFFPEDDQKLRQVELERLMVKNGVVPTDDFSQKAANLMYSLWQKSELSGMSAEEFGIYRKEFIGAYIKDLTMHEIGHVLGLRHNFAGSSLVPFARLRDPEYLEENPISASVMDYNDLNVSGDEKKQGDWVMETLGAYDYLAIEYGYQEVSPKAESRHVEDTSRKIAGKGLKFATDEDLWGPDPYVNTYDLGSDPIALAEERVKLINQKLESIEKRLLTTGDRLDKLTRGVRVLIGDFNRKTRFVAQTIGGVVRYRDRYGLEDSRPAMQPVSAAEQIRAMNYLKEHVFGDGGIQVPQRLLSMMRSNPWDWYQPSTTVSLDRLREYLRTSVLFSLFSPTVLTNLREFHEKQEGAQYSRSQLFAAVHRMVLARVRNMASLSSVDASTQKFLVRIFGYMMVGAWRVDEESRAYARHSLEMLIEDCESRIKELSDSRSFEDGALKVHLKSLRDEAKRFLDPELSLGVW